MWLYRRRAAAQGRPPGVWRPAAARGAAQPGIFRHPTVFADTSNDWRLAREEIFGPVLVAIPWRDEPDAIRMANDSHYGLA
ncbi:MAG TPA: aldehyde dehydrogenase family protein, partial [Acetobacteraceae bacterium]|nr:aldehyde dehydrogenase family protein [Acetobacteraceae bacterium]